MRNVSRAGNGRAVRAGFLAVLALVVALIEAPPPRSELPEGVAASAAAHAPGLDRVSGPSTRRAGGAELGVPFTDAAIHAALASWPGTTGRPEAEPLDVPPGDLAIAPPPDEFDAPPPPPVPPPEPLRRGAFDDVVPAGGVWAVVIGINDYPGTRHDLRSAVADADDVDRALAQFGVAASRRLVLRDREATARSIRLAAQWLVAHAGPDATAVFFFAGHVRKLAAETEAMVGADGQLVTDAELADALRPLQAARAWIVIAACYGGGFTEVLAPGRVLTAAADADSLAYENSYFGRSYLVQYMVREAMIERRAPGSVQRAFAYAEAALGRDYPHRVPVQIDHGHGELVLDKTGGAASTPAPAPSGGGGAPPPSPDGGGSEEPPKDGCSRLTLGVVSCRG